MDFSNRIKYSLVLTVIFSAVAILIVSVLSADGIKLISSRAEQTILSPFAILIAFFVSYILAPFLSSKIKTPDFEEKQSENINRQKNSFAIKSIILALVGLLLVFILKLVLSYFS